MKITAPTLKIDEKATEELIEPVISALPGREKPNAKLTKGWMCHVKCSWTQKGYIASFQNGALGGYYEFENYLSRPQTVALFKSYFEKKKNWQGELRYNKKTLGTLIKRKQK